MSNPDISIASKLPGVEQSIFSIMTALAVKHNAINLAQGFPDFNCPPKLIDLVNKYMHEGKTSMHLCQVSWPFGKRSQPKRKNCMELFMILNLR